MLPLPRYNVAPKYSAPYVYRLTLDIKDNNLCRIDSGPVVSLLFLIPQQNANMHPEYELMRPEGVNN